MYSNSDFNRWRRHPWHGLRAQKDDMPKDIVQVYVEMTPADVVKYELDKSSGFLVVDRPQRTTSSPPALYGFIPRTYCAEEVAARCPGVDIADGDPLDICVFSERHITRADIVLRARVVGGRGSTTTTITDTTTATATDDESTATIHDAGSQEEVEVDEVEGSGEK